MIHSRTFEDHLDHLEMVFKRLESANLMIKPSKCLFAARETKFLGFDISIEGIRPCDEKFDAIQKYPVPLIGETLDELRGCSYFTTLDLSSVYWQMALADEAKGKTAFITRKGLFQFEVLAFGLSNAVSAFQRQMECILEG